MNISLNTVMIHQDPLGLRDIPLLEPDTDGWPAIKQALEQQQADKQRWRKASSWLAVAASLVLVVVLTTRQQDVEQATSATQAAQFVSDNGMENIEALISLSQILESQLRGFGEDTGSISASSTVYIAELQDLVAQVDRELSYSPDSINLWARRVNLLLDLALIYQHHWEEEYGQMASL